MTSKASGTTGKNKNLFSIYPHTVWQVFSRRAPGYETGSKRKQGSAPDPPAGGAFAWVQRFSLNCFSLSLAQTTLFRPFFFASYSMVSAIFK